MKKLVALLLALCMVACLFVGCAEDTADTTAAPETDAPETDAPETDAPETDAPETDAPETEEIPAAIINKVALVTDVGTIDDESFNQACWQGVEAWCTENGVEYTYYQPSEDSTDARVLSVGQAVAEGANVIVMPGYLFGTTLIETQEAYPEVYFIAVDVASGDMTYDYETY